MSKVFVITKGAYSSYHIHAIFSTKEKAESYLNDAIEIGLTKDYDGINEDIEEYELDAVVLDIERLNTYRAKFKVDRALIDLDVYYYDSEGEYEGDCINLCGDELFFNVRAKNIEGAYKVAKERAAIIKESWITNGGRL